MISEAIVHIGLHKTGSTSIQHSLENFDNGEIFYADLGFTNHSIPIYTAFHKDFQDYHIWKRKGLSTENIDNLRSEFVIKLTEQLQKPDRKKIIISGEDISLLDYNGALEFIALINKYVNNIKIICYVRDPLSYAISVFQEYVKNGLTETPKTINPDYSRIEKFVEIVGKEHVLVKVFDTNTFPKGSVVADFCNISGIPFEDITEKRVNQSLSSHALKLLYLFNKTNPLFSGEPTVQRAQQRLISTLQDAYKDAPKIEGQYFLELIDYSDTDFLQQEFGIVFEKTDAESCINTVGLAEWIHAINDIQPEPLLNILENLKIKGELKHLISLVNRVYYQLVFEEQLKKTKYQLLTNQEVDTLRDVAIKYDTKQNLSIDEAITLMKIAQRDRPNAVKIKNMLEKWTMNLDQ